ncbi:MAG: SDR family NAD(P)-dependent oxidoreductase [Gemmataceae bacterium]
MSVLDRFRLDGRRALVTGGSRGLGFEMAKALAEVGAELVLVGRDPAVLDQAAAQLAQPGRAVATLAGDLGRPEDADRVCRSVLERYGPIDVLINNVGGRRISVPTEEMELTDWQRIIDLNLTSAFLCCKLLGGAMVAKRSGAIVNVASIAGLVVNRGIFGRGYETAKAALSAFTKTLAVDWAAYNVRVNAIAPGGFLTDPNRRWFAEKPELRTTFEGMIPMGRLGRAEEIGPLAVYLASDASSYMTGATVVIDGGYTLW